MHLIETARHLTDDRRSVAVRTELGLVIRASRGTGQHKHPNGQVCGASLESLGTHTRHCAVGGWLVRRHNAARTILAEWCEEQNCLVNGDAVLPWAHPGKAEACMDRALHIRKQHGSVNTNISIVNAVYGGPSCRICDPRLESVRDCFPHNNAILSACCGCNLNNRRPLAFRHQGASTYSARRTSCPCCANKRNANTVSCSGRSTALEGR